ncbi:hypothetical protein PQJ75_08950 [Rhodoplanes sp. TEM]|uniref:Uncharacterized protein n=1 Tax=Rhodoplanes tepidamans TaxID=200616 RepID=A0ABT5JJJ8_RHOTP|nr:MULTISPECIES: hypothetical protein [Rhodoplanes]MDC7789668.1 hypothetical protein [Rhodoplanes tepidamans]MDC7983855.1 hypothetical protein [Rhodoplanes sp. TEM]MDQ0359136.1 hypothetical protein [Rhodoplanes tepidamans]
MDLGTLIDRLPEGLEDDLCIFAKKPWTATSAAITAALEEDSKPPEDLLEKGYSYFLEVHAAKEALEAFGGRSPTKLEKRDLLIFYAENDAFPEWMHARGPQDE